MLPPFRNRSTTTVSNSAAATPLWPVSLTQGETRPCTAQAVTSHYRSHFPAVRRYAYAILRCSHDAEDVAQETFLRLIQTMNRDAEPANALPWLLRVTHNLALSRATRRRPEYSLEVCGAECLVDAAPNPEETLFAKQRQRVVQNALTRLSAQELRCWTLRAEGLRYREIAEVLEVSTGTVATHLVRAADKLGAAVPAGLDPARAGLRDSVS